MDIVSKITMKVILGKDVKEIFFEANPGNVNIKTFQPIDVALIYGMAQEEKQKPKDTAYGPNLYISGEFKAKNLINNSMFYSTQLYAPGILHDMIAAQLKNVEPPIEFAFIIGLKYSATSGKEYEYTIRSMVEPKADNSPFAKLEHQMNNPGQPMPADPVKATGTGSGPANGAQIGPAPVNNNPAGTINPEDIVWKD
jgi:hypothetical protein